MKPTLAIAFTIALAAASTAQQKGGTIEPKPAPAKPDPVAVKIAELGDAQKREAALESLATCLDEAGRQLVKAMGSEDAAVRIAVLRLYRRAPDKAPTAQVVALLRDQSADVREQAVLLHAAARPEGWVAELLLLLPREDDTRVKRQIIAGLGASADLNCVPVLIDLLEVSSDEYLQKRTAAALLALTQQKHGRDAAAWRKWWQGGDRIAEAEQARRRAEKKPDTPAPAPAK